MDYTNNGTLTDYTGNKTTTTINNNNNNKNAGSSSSNNNNGNQSNAALVGYEFVAYYQNPTSIKMILV
jgi:hypothetical protein